VLRPRASSAVLVLALALALGFGLAACSDDTAQGSDEAGDFCDGSLESIRQNIFIPNCATTAGCHGAGAASDLDLSLPIEDLEAQLVGVASAVCPDQIRVVPGDPSASFLFAKLHDSPECGEKMPIDGTLSGYELECIEQWIEDVQVECETCGGGECINLLFDEDNCGECGRACPDNGICSGGQCACDDDYSACSIDEEERCVDVLTDVEACGGCSVVCGPGESCNQGQCVGACGDPFEICDEDCVDTQTDPSHCGGCDEACAEDQICVDGDCE